MNDTSCQPKTKFPEEYVSYLQSRVFSSTEVQDWFKRCLDDKPSPARVESIGDYDSLMAQWVDRWFLQFMGKE